ncbi:MAG: histidinol-phosphate transaminase [Candidatus Caenarcaniphilales bacterium]|nr:histidinol-phosphate transaminase [Candidatus Caenarcaniphilales bacterium]
MSINSLNKLYLADLKAYVAGKSTEELAEELGVSPSSIIKLGSNENPLGSSPLSVRAIHEFLNTSNAFNVYPDALGKDLSLALKKKFASQLGDAEIIIGNGMDNILEGIARLILAPGDKVLIHTPTFEYYEIITKWSHAQPVYVQTIPENDFNLDVDEFIAQIKDGVKLVFVCSPNNPTANTLPWPSIEAIIKAAEKHGAFVFLDEAYSEYSGETNIDKVEKFGNLIVGKTFSKIYGLAALRIGWAVIPKDLLNEYRKFQTPFSTNKLGLLAAIAALEDDEFYNESLRMNKEGLQFLTSELTDLGFKVFSSRSNFLPFLAGPKFNNSAQELCNHLKQQGIIVRNASLFLGAPLDLVRITVGRPEQNLRLIEILQTIE